MSKNRNNIDELFKSTFENASFPAPSSAFSAIQSQLSSSTVGAVSTSVSVLKIAVITTSILVAVGSALYLGLASENSSNKLVLTEEKSIKSEEKVSYQKRDQTFGGSQPNATTNSHNTESVIDYSNSNGNNDESAEKSPIKSILPENEGSSNTTVKSILTGENTQNLYAQKPLHDAVNAINSISPEKNNLGRINTLLPKKNCKGRFLVDLEKETPAPHILALGISGDAARFEWGWSGEILGSAQGRSADWEGPIYVKKPQEIQFWVRAHFMDGCRDTFGFSRWVTPQNFISDDVFPSVFTPNGDGFNDSFYVSIPIPKEFDMIIIDMRGNKVFSSNSPSEKWSGYFEKRKCEKGIYKVQVRRKYSGDLQFDVKNFTVELR